MRLGVTRAAEQLSALSLRASSQGIEIVPLPFTRSQPLPFKLPSAVSLDRIDWLFFTSANGVRFFFEQFDHAPFDSAQGEVGGTQGEDTAAQGEVKVSHSEIEAAKGEVLSRKTKIAAVGDKTAAAIKAAGYVVHFQPSQSVGEVLFNQFVDANQAGEILLWARGKDVNFDPVELFAKTEHKYYSVICYETVANEVDQQVVAGFDDKDYILFTAPSAVREHNEKFGMPTARPIAIGPTTAAAMTNCGWPEFKIMKQPDVDRVLEYL